nr:rve domain-containing protein/RVT_3 domain-containing protein [Tanacetum cinerariifolium]
MVVKSNPEKEMIADVAEVFDNLRRAKLCSVGEVSLGVAGGNNALVPRCTSYTVDQHTDCKEEWVLYTDGASCRVRSITGMIKNSKENEEEGKWPEDPNEARTLQIKINQHVMEEGVLFKRSYFMPMLRCLGSLQANYVIQEIHMGACNMHLKARSMVAKAIQQGYYWPTMHRDAREEIRKCDSCQIHYAVPKLPKTLITSIMAPWPFYQWGTYVLGPLPKAYGKVNFVIVAIDYFTKWIEAKPLAKTTRQEERREATAIREARYKMTMEHYYNKR